MAIDLDPHYSLLDDLDARQDDLLGQLDQLNQRIELLLGQFGSLPVRIPSPAFTGPPETPARVPLAYSGSPSWATEELPVQEPS